MNQSNLMEFEYAVIGAGVIGLSIAKTLSNLGSTILIEKNSQFGQETSSRNSEVIHSGIYYPSDSVKTISCLEGRKKLVKYCEEKKIPFRKTGKLVISNSESDSEYLNQLSQHCDEIKVPYQKLNEQNVTQIEPLIKAKQALIFPQSGIIDTHQLMQSFENELINNDTIIAYQHKVINIDLKNECCFLELESNKEKLKLKTKILINAAGLAAAELSNLALNTQKYTHRFCRGRYFQLKTKFTNKFSHLIYPVPQKDGLGIHVTIDMNGQARLGPDVDWMDCSQYKNINSFYDCKWEESISKFYQAAKKYCPNLHETDLNPGLIGIRPKLFINEKAKADFLIEKNGPFIHCLGIESPGITSALSIADSVRKLL